MSCACSSKTPAGQPWVKPGHDAKLLADVPDVLEFVGTNSKRYKRCILLADFSNLCHSRS